MGVLTLLACGGVETLPARGPEAVAACAADAACPQGMVCEGCSGPQDAQCVPGCRVDAQCPGGHVCQLGVTCLTCPCAPGWCELDPCRDVDGDGFAFTTNPTVSCPGKRLGDCNDGNRAVNPGAKELCANGIDDDCDGFTDRNDASCQQCTPDSQVCNDAAECLSNGSVGNETCSRGCCQSCPLVANPMCAAGQRAVGGGLDVTTACRVARVCISSTCANNAFDPMCGRDFATYRNPCELQEAGVELLHRGRCEWNEGRPCATSSCPQRQYCRTDALAGPRCTLAGACLVDADCPAGVGGAPVCVADGGVGTFRCERGQCVSRCQER
jgi:hypothetical protein